MSEYTLTVDGKTYELTREFREFVQESAESAYESNEYTSTWWKRTDGDPILVIETSGHMMPFEYIDEVADEPIDEDEEGGRLYFLQENSENENVGQPERSDDDTTIPEMTQEVPEDEDVLVAPVPEVGPEWGVGEAVIPMEGTYERNLQKMVDESGSLDRDTYNESATYDDGERYDAPHEQGSWKWLLESFDCEVLDTKQFTDDDADSTNRRPDDWFDDTEKGESKAEGEVGNRFHL